MNKKLRLGLLFVSMLTLLSGCSFLPNSGGQGGVDRGQFPESIRKLREKYSKDSPYDVQEKVIHIKDNESITIPSKVGKLADFETLPHEGQKELISSFEIYGDSSLRAVLGADFTLNDDKEIEIRPAYHFPSTRVEPDDDRSAFGLAKQEESWGVFDTLYLLQRDDENTGKKLDKPKLWVVKIDKEGRDKLALRVKSSLLSDGRLQLEWTDVPGAEAYSIVKREFLTLPDSESKTGLYVYKEVDRVKSTVYRTEAATNNDVDNGGRSADDPASMRQRLLQAYDVNYSANKTEDKPYELFVVPLKGQDALGSVSNAISSDDFASQMPDRIEDRTFSDQAKEMRKQGNIPSEAPLLMMNGRLRNFPIIYEKIEKSGSDVVCQVSIKGMPSIKTDFRIESATVEQVQAVTDQINQAANKEEGKSGVYEPYVSLEQANLDLNGKTVVRDVSEIEAKVAAKTAAQEYFAKALASTAEYVDYSDFPELSPSDVSDLIRDVLEQNPTLLQNVEPFIDGEKHVVQFKYDEAEKAKYKQATKKVQEVVKEIIRDDMSDRQKVEAINQYLIDHVSYDHPAYESNKKYKDVISNQASSEEDEEKALEERKKFDSSYTIVGPLLEGKGVCAAYAKTFQALAQEAGLESMYVKGMVDITELHAWNFVKVDGEWLVIDCTWNDTDGDSGKTENAYLMLAMDDPLYNKDHNVYSSYLKAIQE